MSSQDLEQYFGIKLLGYNVNLGEGILSVHCVWLAGAKVGTEADSE